MSKAHSPGTSATTYLPRPLETDQVELPPELAPLTERIAEHVHDIWSKARLQDGWTFGPNRDDQRKLHPCLVPYHDLAEDEKVYDRNTATETLRAAIVLGASITWEEQVVQGTNSACIRHMGSWLPETLPDDLDSLMEMWRSRPARDALNSAADCVALASKMISRGEPLFAYDIVAWARERFSEDNDLLRLGILALNRAGSPEAAIKWCADGDFGTITDPDLIGVAAAAWKSAAFAAESEADRHELLDHSLRLYVRAYDLANASQNLGSVGYTSINAAFVACCLERKGEADFYARAAERAARSELEGKGLDWSNPLTITFDDYWLFATLAEAALIQGRAEEARAFYRELDLVAGTNHGYRASPRRQLMRMSSLNRQDLEGLELSSWIKPYKVACFVGHMVDALDRKIPRLPFDRQSDVKTMISNWFENENPDILYVFGYPGADIIAAEAMLERKGHVHLILHDTTNNSVSNVKTYREDLWDERLRYIAENAYQVTSLDTVGGAAMAVEHSFTSELVLGLASLRAKQLDGIVRGFSFWDGKVGDGPYGTEWTIRGWLKHGLAVDVGYFDKPWEPLTTDMLELQDPSRSEIADVEGHDLTRLNDLIQRGALSNNTQRRNAVFLFADTVCFSQLSEDFIPSFLDKLLLGVRRMLDEAGVRPICIQIWGDAVFMALEDASVAAFIADQLSSLDVTFLGEEVRLRIACHIGPGHMLNDPFSQQTYMSGRAVNFAARMEPITPPGTVYVSEAFAAVLALEQDSDYSVQYAGRIPLSKNAGTAPVYSLSRRLKRNL